MPLCYPFIFKNIIGVNRKILFIFKDCNKELISGNNDKIILLTTYANL
jgi:hypothetical protein